MYFFLEGGGGGGGGLEKGRVLFFFGIKIAIIHRCSLPLKHDHRLLLTD